MRACKFRQQNFNKSDFWLFLLRFFREQQIVSGALLANTTSFSSYETTVQRKKDQETCSNIEKLFLSLLDFLVINVSWRHSYYVEKKWIGLSVYSYLFGMVKLTSNSPFQDKRIDGEAKFVNDGKIWSANTWGILDS